MHKDIQSILDQLGSASAEAAALTSGLSEPQAALRPTPESWSISQLLEHLALTNNLYLSSMRQAAEAGRRRGKLRRRPAHPGLAGRWFANKLEPPITPKFRIKTISKLEPGSAPPLAQASSAFVDSQAALEHFVRDSSDLDLASSRYANPIVRGLNFSIASGLHILLAHERRHLWQARQIRNAIQATTEGSLP